MERFFRVKKFGEVFWQCQRILKDMVTFFTVNITLHKKENKKVKNQKKINCFVGKMNFKLSLDNNIVSKIYWNFKNNVNLQTKKMAYFFCEKIMKKIELTKSQKICAYPNFSLTNFHVCKKAWVKIRTIHILLYIRKQIVQLCTYEF